MKRLSQLILHIIICVFLSVCTSGSGNFPPVAVIDGELKTYKNEPLRLDGTKSMDPDGDELRFFWEVTAAPSGSIPVLGDVHSSTPLFIGDRDGIYEVTLVVSDGKEESEPEIARLMVFRDNLTPIADAGGDSSIKITDTMTLDGRASADPTNRPLKFTWSIKSKPENSNAVIENSSSSIARFKPDVPHSSYEIELIVSNGEYESEPDTVLINVLNSVPQANAGPNVTIRPGQTYILRGSGEDADGDVITGYSWRLISHPGDPNIVRIENPDTQECKLITDNYAVGNYIIELKVYDGQAWSEPDNVIITTVNSPPNVDAGIDRTVGHCFNGVEYVVKNDNNPSCPGALNLKLTGSASDPDNDTLSYQWSIVNKPPSAPAPVFLNENDKNTEVDIRSVSPNILGEYEFRLTAVDSYGLSSWDNVKITVTNRAPTSGGCTAGCNQSFTFSNCTGSGSLCYTPSLVTVNNIATLSIDPDGDPLFNEFYLAPNGGSNCVYSYGIWCASNQSCLSSLALGAFAFVSCSTTHTWAGTNTIRVKFKDGFGSQYNDNTDDVSITVNCSSCN